MREITIMKAYTAILAVVATVAFPGLLMAENSNANIAANEAVQMNDAEMDNVTAAGLGKDGAPGQLMKQQFQSQLSACGGPGKGCAFGQIKKQNATLLLSTSGSTHGASGFAPGHK
jgi:hypothetical protein